jgi:hypothetical protein
LSERAAEKLVAVMSLSPTLTSSRLPASASPMVTLMVEQLLLEVSSSFDVTQGS